MEAWKRRKNYNPMMAAGMKYYKEPAQSYVNKELLYWWGLILCLDFSVKICPNKTLSQC